MMLNQPTMSGLTVVVWLGAILAGFAKWEKYDHTPGPEPIAEVDLAVASSPCEVVMFLHPQCPCSRASLGELIRMVSFFPGRTKALPDIRVVMVLPDGVGEDWEQSSLCDLASSARALMVGHDRGGRAARKAGVVTSGHVIVRDAEGGVVFSGGITPARGRSGLSPGASALRAILDGEPVSGKFPVYGCPLFDSDIHAAGEQPCR